jgi:hypothetical protein
MHFLVGMNGPRGNPPGAQLQKSSPFSQASGSSPTVPPFTNAINWTASTPAADDVLQSNLLFADEELDEASTLLLHLFQVSTALSSVSSEIKAKDWVGK